MSNDNKSDVKVLPLAPPASKTSWMVKNPVSLLLEVVLIFYMFLFTLLFKTFRLVLPTSKKSVNGKVVLVNNTVTELPIVLKRRLLIYFKKQDFFFLIFYIFDSYIFTFTRRLRQCIRFLL